MGPTRSSTPAGDRSTCDTLNCEHGARFAERPDRPPRWDEVEPSLRRRLARRSITCWTCRRTVMFDERDGALRDAVPGWGGIGRIGGPLPGDGFEAVLTMIPHRHQGGRPFRAYARAVLWLRTWRKP